MGTYFTQQIYQTDYCTFFSFFPKYPYSPDWPHCLAPKCFSIQQDTLSCARFEIKEQTYIHILYQYQYHFNCHNQNELEKPIWALLSWLYILKTLKKRFILLIFLTPFWVGMSWLDTRLSVHLLFCYWFFPLQLFLWATAHYQKFPFFLSSVLFLMGQHTFRSIPSYR